MSVSEYSSGRTVLTPLQHIREASDLRRDEREDSPVSRHQHRLIPRGHDTGSFSMRSPSYHYTYTRDGVVMRAGPTPGPRGRDRGSLIIQ
ncbi:unnamed protein product [Danaus chrysippus]|uniref:(African queen) hypothetical protein n=1 Tax=Danaus chrysippus TaxID=151541 RepID=A0A8J2W7X3_9NEOP|nr:unnamed protein product [Danaus chrysippus]